MVLYYNVYVKLLTALKEYCKNTLNEAELHMAIMKRYCGENIGFVAENAVGSKRFFMLRYQRSKDNKKERIAFTRFMKETSVKKAKKEKKTK